MDLMQMFQSLQQNKNPLFERAVQMAQGKSEAEVKEIVKNLAAQRGVDIQQLNNMLAQFGLRL